MLSSICNIKNLWRLWQKVTNGNRKICGQKIKNLRGKHKKSVAKIQKVFPLIYGKMAFLAKTRLRTVAIVHKFTKNRHSVVSVYIGKRYFIERITVYIGIMSTVDGQ